MSFILDALRKSEQERQRNEQPGIAGVQVQSAAARNSFWVPLVVVLIVINAGLLAFLWVNATPDEPSISPAATTTAAKVEAPRNNQASVPLNLETANRRLSDEIAEPATRQAAAQATTAQQRPAATSNSDSSYTNLPTMLELTMAGSIELKPLHLDIHVFSEKPAERFIFINMAKYREGDQLKEGPVVSAINEVGVELKYQGREFLLTRE